MTDKSLWFMVLQSYGKMMSENRERINKDLIIAVMLRQLLRRSISRTQKARPCSYRPFVNLGTGGIYACRIVLNLNAITVENKMLALNVIQCCITLAHLRPNSKLLLYKAVYVKRFHCH